MRLGIAIIAASGSPGIQATRIRGGWKIRPFPGWGNWCTRGSRQAGPRHPAWSGWL